VELMILVIGLCVLGVLALRFGHDSRPLAHSKELDLANLGLSWPSSHQPGENTVPDMCRDTCYAPARWLSWIRTIAAGGIFEMTTHQD
jgi:hypothetical protein